MKATTEMLAAVCVAAIVVMTKTTTGDDKD